MLTRRITQANSAVVFILQELVGSGSRNGYNPCKPKELRSSIQAFLLFYFEFCRVLVDMQQIESLVVINNIIGLKTGIITFWKYIN